MEWRRKVLRIRSRKREGIRPRNSFLIYPSLYATDRPIHTTQNPTRTDRDSNKNPQTRLRTSSTLIRDRAASSPISLLLYLINQRCPTLTAVKYKDREDHHTHHNNTLHQISFPLETTNSRRGIFVHNKQRILPSYTITIRMMLNL